MLVLSRYVQLYSIDKGDINTFRVYFSTLSAIIEQMDLRRRDDPPVRKTFYDFEGVTRAEAEARECSRRSSTEWCECGVQTQIASRADGGG